MSQRGKGKAVSMSQASSSQGPGSKGKVVVGRKRASQGDDDEEEFDASQGASQSQGVNRAEAAWTTMSNAEKAVNINKLVNFLLMRDADKMPAKRADINDLFKNKAAGNKAPPTSVVTKLISEARKKLLHVYGFDLVELESGSINDDVTQSQSANAKAGWKLYMLKNSLKYPLEDQVEAEEPAQQEGDEEWKREAREREMTEKRAKLIGLGDPEFPSAHYNLTLTLMTIICLKRYSVSELELKAFMSKLGADVTMTDHSTFGNVADTLKEICAQGYLHQKKTKDRDGQPQISYCLGLRGESEVKRLRMLNFAEEIFGEKMLASTRKDLLEEAVDSDDDE